MSVTDHPMHLASRRQVLKHTLSTGFALAVTPIAATAFATDTDGLEAGEVTIPTSAGDIPGYRALPLKPKAKVPVILVVHEIFGVHEHIKDVCRRFAKEGYTRSPRSCSPAKATSPS